MSSFTYVAKKNKVQPADVAGAEGGADSPRSASVGLRRGEGGRVGGLAAIACTRGRKKPSERHLQRTLATWEGFVKDGLKNIRTKKRRREEPAEDAVT